MNWNISFEPILSWPLIATVAAVGVAMLIALVIGRARGTLLRALSFVLLIAALANPVVRSEQRQPLPDIAVAVVDHSLSQQNGDRPKRTAAAIDALKQAVERLPNTELRTIEVKSGAAGSMRSLHQFMALRGGDLAVRFDLNPPSVQEVATRVDTSGGPRDVRYRLLSLPLSLVERVADVVRGMG